MMKTYSKKHSFIVSSQYYDWWYNIRLRAFHITIQIVCTCIKFDMVICPQAQKNRKDKQQYEDIINKLETEKMVIHRNMIHDVKIHHLI